MMANLGLKLHKLETSLTYHVFSILLKEKETTYL